MMIEKVKKVPGSKLDKVMNSWKRADFSIFEGLKELRRIREWKKSGTSGNEEFRSMKIIGIFLQKGFHPIVWVHRRIKQPPTRLIICLKAEPLLIPFAYKYFVPFYDDMYNRITYVLRFIFCWQFEPTKINNILWSTLIFELIPKQRWTMCAPLC